MDPLKEWKEVGRVIRMLYLELRMRKAVLLSLQQRKYSIFLLVFLLTYDCPTLRSPFHSRFETAAVLNFIIARTVFRQSFVKELQIICIMLYFGNLVIFVKP